MPSLLTALALIAFAANSVLCRIALGGEEIDPWSFTAIRLGAGALMLFLITARTRALRRRTRWNRSDDAARSVSPGDRLAGWKRAAYLVLYALPFSLAYVDLDTGTGALLLFGAVQLTMIVLGIRRGERPANLEWLGLFGAAAGMLYFVLPGVSAPDPVGAALMIVAGIGWGLYSLAGKPLDMERPGPAVTTAKAFTRAAVVVVPVTGVAAASLSVSAYGLLLATVSGAVTSGVGYVIWYAALRHLSATRAALVQLSVPIIAAAGGVAFLAEEVTVRLVIASVVILGSIALGVTARRSSRPG
jgi:drug/metabolite transporter (DMT)-like permease